MYAVKEMKRLQLFQVNYMYAVKEMKRQLFQVNLHWEAERVSINRNVDVFYCLPCKQF